MGSVDKNREQQYKLSEEEQRLQKLYDMPLADLRRLAVSVLPPVGQKRTPEVQDIISICCDREIAQIAEENGKEYEKMLRGEPHDFDEYAPC